MAIKIERNMQASRKSNNPGFTRGTSSRSQEDKNKKLEIQESSSDYVKELTQLIKQMDINHANRLTTMKNRFISMESSQANRFHPKKNDKWKKKPPSQEHRIPCPLETNNMVDHQAIP